MSRVRVRAVTVAFAGVALAASMILTGCAIPLPHGASGGGTGGDGQSGSGTSSDSGTSNDAGAGGQGSIPSTFPGDVPLISGDVFLGLDLGTGWSVTIKVDDAFSGYDAAKAKLLAAGYTSLVDTKSDKGAFGSFQNGTYTINLTANTDVDPSPTVTYVVVKLG